MARYVCVIILFVTIQRLTTLNEKDFYQNSDTNQQGDLEAHFNDYDEDDAHNISHEENNYDRIDKAVTQVKFEDNQKRRATIIPLYDDSASMALERPVRANNLNVFKNNNTEEARYEQTENSDRKETNLDNYLQIPNHYLPKSDLSDEYIRLQITETDTEPNNVKDNGVNQSRKVDDTDDIFNYNDGHLDVRSTDDKDNRTKVHKDDPFRILHSNTEEFIPKKHWFQKLFVNESEPENNQENQPVPESSNYKIASAYINDKLSNYLYEVSRSTNSPTKSNPYAKETDSAMDAESILKVNNVEDAWGRPVLSESNHIHHKRIVDKPSTENIKSYGLMFNEPNDTDSDETLKIHENKSVLSQYLDDIYRGRKKKTSFTTKMHISPTRRSNSNEDDYNLGDAIVQKAIQKPSKHLIIKDLTGKINTEDSGPYLADASQAPKPKLIDPSDLEVWQVTNAYVATKPVKDKNSLQDSNPLDYLQIWRARTTQKSINLLSDKNYDIWYSNSSEDFNQISHYLKGTIKDENERITKPEIIDVNPWSKFRPVDETSTPKLAEKLNENEMTELDNWKLKQNDPDLSNEYRSQDEKGTSDLELWQNDKVKYDSKAKMVHFQDDLDIWQNYRDRIESEDTNVLSNKKKKPKYDIQKKKSDTKNIEVWQVDKMYGISDDIKGGTNTGNFDDVAQISVKKPQDSKKNINTDIRNKYAIPNDNIKKLSIETKTKKSTYLDDMEISEYIKVLTKNKQRGKSRILDNMEIITTMKSSDVDSSNDRNYLNLFKISEQNSKPTETDLLDLKVWQRNSKKSKSKKLKVEKTSESKKQKPHERLLNVTSDGRKKTTYQAKNKDKIDTWQTITPKDLYQQGDEQTSSTPGTASDLDVKIQEVNETYLKYSDKKNDQISNSKKNETTQGDSRNQSNYKTNWNQKIKYFDYSDSEYVSSFAKSKYGGSKTDENNWKVNTSYFDESKSKYIANLAKADSQNPKMMQNLQPSSSDKKDKARLKGISKSNSLKSELEGSPKKKKINNKENWKIDTSYFDETGSKYIANLTEPDSRKPKPVQNDFEKPNSSDEKDKTLLKGLSKSKPLKSKLEGSPKINESNKKDNWKVITSYFEESGSKYSDSPAESKTQKHEKKLGGHTKYESEEKKLKKYSEKTGSKHNTKSKTLESKMKKDDKLDRAHDDANTQLLAPQPEKISRKTDTIKDYTLNYKKQKEKEKLKKITEDLEVWTRRNLVTKSFKKSKIVSTESNLQVYEQKKWSKVLENKINKKLLQVTTEKYNLGILNNVSKTKLVEDLEVWSLNKTGNNVSKTNGSTNEHDWILNSLYVDPAERINLRERLQQKHFSDPTITTPPHVYDSTTSFSKEEYDKQHLPGPGLSKYAFDSLNENKAKKLDEQYVTEKLDNKQDSSGSDLSKYVFGLPYKKKKSGKMKQDLNVISNSSTKKEQVNQVLDIELWTSPQENVTEKLTKQTTSKTKGCKHKKVPNLPSTSPKQLYTVVGKISLTTTAQDDDDIWHANTTILDADHKKFLTTNSINHNRDILSTRINTAVQKPNKPDKVISEIQKKYKKPYDMLKTKCTTVPPLQTKLATKLHLISNKRLKWMQSHTENYQRPFTTHIPKKEIKDFGIEKTKDVETNSDLSDSDYDKEEENLKGVWVPKGLYKKTFCETAVKNPSTNVSTTLNGTGTWNNQRVYIDSSGKRHNIICMNKSNKTENNNFFDQKIWQGSKKYTKLHRFTVKPETLFIHKITEADEIHYILEKAHDKLSHVVPMSASDRYLKQLLEEKAMLNLEKSKALKQSKVIQKNYEKNSDTYSKTKLKKDSKITVKTTTKTPKKTSPKNKNEYTTIAKRTQTLVKDMSKTKEQKTHKKTNKLPTMNTKTTHSKTLTKNKNVLPFTFSTVLGKEFTSTTLAKREQTVTLNVRERLTTAQPKKYKVTILSKIDKGDQSNKSKKMTTEKQIKNTQNYQEAEKDRLKNISTAQIFLSSTLSSLNTVSSEIIYTKKNENLNKTTNKILSVSDILRTITSNKTMSLVKSSSVEEAIDEGKIPKLSATFGTNVPTKVTPINTQTITTLQTSSSTGSTADTKTSILNNLPSDKLFTPVFWNKQKITTTTDKYDDVYDYESIDNSDDVQKFIAKKVLSKLINTTSSWSNKNIFSNETSRNESLKLIVETVLDSLANDKLLKIIEKEKIYNSSNEILDNTYQLKTKTTVYKLTDNDTETEREIQFTDADNATIKSPKTQKNMTGSTTKNIYSSILKSSYETTSETPEHVKILENIISNKNLNVVPLIDLKSQKNFGIDYLTTKALVKEIIDIIVDKNNVTDSHKTNKIKELLNETTSAHRNLLNSALSTFYNVYKSNTEKHGMKIQDLSIVPIHDKEPIATKILNEMLSTRATNVDPIQHIQNSFKSNVNRILSKKKNTGFFDYSNDFVDKNEDLKKFLQKKPKIGRRYSSTTQKVISNFFDALYQQPEFFAADAAHEKERMVPESEPVEGVLVNTDFENFASHHDDIERVNDAFEKSLGMETTTTTENYDYSEESTTKMATPTLSTTRKIPHFPSLLDALRDQEDTEDIEVFKKKSYENTYKHKATEMAKSFVFNKSTDSTLSTTTDEYSDDYGESIELETTNTGSTVLTSTQKLLRPISMDKIQKKDDELLDNTKGKHFNKYTSGTSTMEPKSTYIPTSPPLSVINHAKDATGPILVNADNHTYLVVKIPSVPTIAAIPKTITKGIATQDDREITHNVEENITSKKYTTSLPINNIIQMNVTEVSPMNTDVINKTLNTKDETNAFTVFLEVKPIKELMTIPTSTQNIIQKLLPLEAMIVQPIPKSSFRRTKVGLIESLKPIRPALDAVTIHFENEPSSEHRVTYNKDDITTDNQTTALDTVTSNFTQYSKQSLFLKNAVPNKTSVQNFESKVVDSTKVTMTNVVLENTTSSRTLTPPYVKIGIPFTSYLKVVTNPSTAEGVDSSAKDTVATTSMPFLTTKRLQNTQTTKNIKLMASTSTLSDDMIIAILTKRMKDRHYVEQKLIEKQIIQPPIITTTDKLKVVLTPDIKVNIEPSLIVGLNVSKTTTKAKHYPKTSVESNVKTAQSVKTMKVPSITIDFRNLNTSHRRLQNQVKSAVKYDTKTDIYPKNRQHYHAEKSRDKSLFSANNNGNFNEVWKSVLNKGDENIIADKEMYKKYSTVITPHVIDWKVGPISSLAEKFDTGDVIPISNFKHIKNSVNVTTERILETNILALTQPPQEILKVINDVSYRNKAPNIKEIFLTMSTPAEPDKLLHRNTTESIHIKQSILIPTELDTDEGVTSEKSFPAIDSVIPEIVNTQPPDVILTTPVLNVNLKNILDDNKDLEIDVKFPSYGKPIEDATQAPVDYNVLDPQIHNSINELAKLSEKTETSTDLILKYNIENLKSSSMTSGPPNFSTPYFLTPPQSTDQPKMRLQMCKIPPSVLDHNVLSLNDPTSEPMLVYIKSKSPATEADYGLSYDLKENEFKTGDIYRKKFKSTSSEQPIQVISTITEPPTTDNTDFLSLAIEKIQSPSDITTDVFIRVPTDLFSTTTSTEITTIVFNDSTSLYEDYEGSAQKLSTSLLMIPLAIHVGKSANAVVKQLEQPTQPNALDIIVFTKKPSSQDSETKLTDGKILPIDNMEMLQPTEGKRVRLTTRSRKRLTTRTIPTTQTTKRFTPPNIRPITRPTTTPTTRPPVELTTTPRIKTTTEFTTTQTEPRKTIWDTTQPAINYSDDLTTHSATGNKPVIEVLLRAYPNKTFSILPANGLFNYMDMSPQALAPNIEAPVIDHLQVLTLNNKVPVGEIMFPKRVTERLQSTQSTLIPNFSTYFGTRTITERTHLAKSSTTPIIPINDSYANVRVLPTGEYKGAVHPQETVLAVPILKNRTNIADMTGMNMQNYVSKFDSRIMDFIADTQKNFTTAANVSVTTQQVPTTLEETKEEKEAMFLSEFKKILFDDILTKTIQNKNWNIQQFLDKMRKSLSSPRSQKKTTVVTPTTTTEKLVTNVLPSKKTFALEKDFFETNWKNFFLRYVSTETPTTTEKKKLVVLEAYPTLFDGKQVHDKDDTYKQIKFPSVESDRATARSFFYNVTEPAMLEVVEKDVPIDTCGVDNSPVQYVREEPTKIEKYPWLGSLVYPQGKQRLVTPVVLVHVQLVIAAARDIDKLPKKDFRYRAKVVLGTNCTGPRVNIVNYNYHQEFAEGFFSLAIIQVDPLPILKMKIRPICPPPNLQATYPNEKLNDRISIYAMVMAEDCKISQVSLYKMEYVALQDCRHFYRTQLFQVGHNLMWPKYTVCARSRRQAFCTWRTGTLLVAHDNGVWRLLGFGVTGPGCESPSRYIDYMMYSSWVSSALDKIGQPAVTRLAPNQLILRRNPLQIQRFGPCDPEEIKVEIFTDSADVAPPASGLDSFSIEYNLTFFQNVDYQCVIFHAFGIDGSQPMVDLQYQCYSDPDCFNARRADGVRSNNAINFNILISFRSPFNYRVNAYGREGTQMNPKATLRFVNEQEEFAQIPRNQIYIKPRRTLTRFKTIGGRYIKQRDNEQIWRTKNHSFGLSSLL